ncbi:hypothetical protein NC796_01310 [Aliifodinibius sp. S!AR15-10]|uniref:hypothetical protein n=1 Tax=Aliifodinibius sp. S!AR15-10 TaxID=2950437 RepID=UPI002863232B|nr:hypothetical protein [Aliifodinibius sp. S!AR15-10]MDR8389754.1 hypothetical protein [Aliifodinibius sp. S!AR15-10]
MSSDSREQRERLKEEYKEHYRKMREAKEEYNRARRKKNITDALRDMDTLELMQSFDDFLFSVKSKIANVEARLDVAMDSLEEETEFGMSEQERDEELQKAKAKDTLKQVKLEMGKLYQEIERQANSMNVQKTIGSQKPGAEDDTDSQSEG